VVVGPFLEGVKDEVWKKNTGTFFRSVMFESFDFQDWTPHEKYSKGTRAEALKTTGPVKIKSFLAAETASDASRLVINVFRAIHIPRMDEGGKGKSDPYVKIQTCGQRKKTKMYANKSDCVWDEEFEFDIKDADGEEEIEIQMFDKDTLSSDDLIGFVKMKLKDFVERKEHIFFMTAPNDSMVIKKSRFTPMELTVQVTKIPASLKKYRDEFEAEEEKKFDKEVMVLSRGTRGDVQPFVALARGLANELNWSVTIVTELRWESFVKRYKKVSKGRIRFRPSGGDTAKRIDGKLAKWAVTSTSELIQATMMARAEGEFFDSEPIFYKTAQDMKPELLIFGFTIVNVAMIVSQALKIPLMGFILQPTCIPSDDYTAIIPIGTHQLGLIDKLEESFVSHGFQKFLKQMMESNSVGAGLNDMRKSRGLPAFGDDDTAWKELIKQNSPVICPINPITFCKKGSTKPAGWSENIILTEFIFLQGGATPDLNDTFKNFIASAKEQKEPLVVMAFSSMPVPRESIMSMACKMIEECKTSPRVIALIGKRDISAEPLKKKTQDKFDQFIGEGKLLEAGGAPFSVLFGEMDCIIMHGGLGTTAEAMRCGVPVICTGVLLMDQRFWGQQIENLGIGPEPCHISNFKDRCVENIDTALEPNSKWKAEAVKLAKKIQAKSPDGVPENIAAVQDLLEKHSEPFIYPFQKKD